MTKKEYKLYQIKKITNELKKKFYEKLGYVPIIQIIDNRLEEILLLEDLEKIIVEFIPKEIKSKSLKDACRKRELADLRHIFCYIAKNMGYSLSETGKYLNNRHHTTALNSIRKADHFIKIDDEFKLKYEKIMKKINEYVEDGNKLLYTADEESSDTESTLSSVLL